MFGPVAQRIRALVFGTRCRGFESLRGRHCNTVIAWWRCFLLPASHVRLAKRINNGMKLEQLRTVSVVRPGNVKRYSLLPVDCVDVTGLYASYADLHMQLSQLYLWLGYLVMW